MDNWHHGCGSKESNSFKGAFMQLSSIMSNNVESISPDDSIQHAAQMMKSLDVGSLPVCDGEKLMGILTDRDIAIRAIAAGADSNMHVREAMTPNAVYCFDDEDVRCAVEMMEERQIRRLPVLNRDERLVGILSLGDLALRCDRDMSGEALEQISQSCN